MMVSFGSPNTYPKIIATDLYGTKQLKSLNTASPPDLTTKYVVGPGPPERHIQVFSHLMPLSEQSVRFSYLMMQCLRFDSL